MLKTTRGIEARLDVDWSSLKDSIIDKLERTFNRCPNYFFTEHDIHSVLYNIAEEELKLRGVSSESTNDGFQVALVHHEYPTPFRCCMKDLRFELKDEKPYRRGHYDLVILNPNFIKANALQVVCGKDYGKFRSAMKDVKVEPLIWACEVVFFPGTTYLPRNATKVVKQEALKLKETLRYEIGNGVRFCRYASVLVLTSHETRKVKNLVSQMSMQQNSGSSLSQKRY